MRLKIRYEQEFQTIELDAEATEQLWVSLSLEGEGLSQEEREQRIQDAFDEQYNRPEYGNLDIAIVPRGRRWFLDSLLPGCGLPCLLGK